MKYKVEVTFSIGGTITKDCYTCEDVTITMRTKQSESVTVLKFKSGEDQLGSIEVVMYEFVHKITKRVFKEE